METNAINNTVELNCSNYASTYFFYVSVGIIVREDHCYTLYAYRICNLYGKKGRLSPMSDVHRSVQMQAINRRRFTILDSAVMNCLMKFHFELCIFTLSK